MSDAALTTEERICHRSREKRQTLVVRRSGMAQTAARSDRAKIDLDGGISCLIVNLSDTKATIEVALPFSLPIEFEVAIEGENKKRYCAISWRRNGRVGVFFV
jgi:hypothetical protein